MVCVCWFACLLLLFVFVFIVLCLGLFAFCILTEGRKRVSRAGYLNASYARKYPAVLRPFCFVLYFTHVREDKGEIIAYSTTVL